MFFNLVSITKSAYICIVILMSSEKRRRSP